MVQVCNVDLGNFPLLLAPMEDVSDPPFRHICKGYGVDLVFTEFISSEGLIRDAAKSIKKLDIFANERPVGIQIFGNEIDSMREAAKIVEEVKPTFLDINYGCPVYNVACRGAGAGILKDLDKMEKMTAEIVKQVSIPVTVKTRLGWDESTIKINEVARRLQDVGIKALSIHARTRSQMYKGEARWEYIAKVKEDPRIKIPIFGNGDIDSAKKAIEYKKKYGVDGIMIGRAAIGNPFIFKEIKHLLKTGNELPPISKKERIETIKKHLELSIEWKGEKLGILETRRHYSRYLKGIEDIKDLKDKLIRSNSISEIFDTLNFIYTT